MKYTEQRTDGSVIEVVGPTWAVRRLVASWAEREQPAAVELQDHEPEPQGAGAHVEHSGTRRFETEGGPWSPHDVPVIHALGFQPNRIAA